MLQISYPQNDQSGRYYHATTHPINRCYVARRVSGIKQDLANLGNHWRSRALSDTCLGTLQTPIWVETGWHMYCSASSLLRSSSMPCPFVRGVISISWKRNLTWNLCAEIWSVKDVLILTAKSKRPGSRKHLKRLSTRPPSTLQRFSALSQLGQTTG